MHGGRFGKDNRKGKAHYTNMAYTTALETLNHLVAAIDLDYISESDYLLLRNKIESITTKLSALRKSQLS